MAETQEWSLNGFLDELKRIDTTMTDRRFVFILGAGASIESGIKGAEKLAEEWMRIMFRRKFVGKTSEEHREYEAWLKTDPLNAGDNWNTKNLAAFYPTIFGKCFEGDHEAGFAELERAIENHSPSFGYAVLAWVLAQSRHNMVITTNFDNLVADSLYIYGGKTPHVIGHESLAGYLKPMARRPMIAKIHRDLFTDPINDESGVGELKSQWSEALRNIFRFYTPVFIGYGGNDGSLMNFLKGLETNDISGRPFWCYYEKGEKPNGDIGELMEKHEGVLVPTPGFDQLMFKIGSTWGYERQLQHHSVSEHTKRMLDTLDENIQKVYQESPKEIRAQLREINAEDEKNWLDWMLEAEDKKTHDEKEKVYLEALLAQPKSNQLMNGYAILLYDSNRHEEAEQYYKRALNLKPDSAIYLGNYAILLGQQKRNEEAEQYFKQALTIEPNSANCLGNYANLLAAVDRYEESEQRYKQALEITPDDSDILGNYAHLLEKLERYDEAEQYYKKAFEVGAKGENHLCNYADLLDKLKKYVEAEQYYLKALEIAPDDSTILGNYAELLDKLERNDEAEQYFKAALEGSSDDAILFGNFAEHLFKLGRLDEAREYYKKSLDIEHYDYYQERYKTLLGDLKE